MRISDWSSDVCSSDLAILHRAPQRGHPTWAMNDEADFRAGLPWCRAHRGLLAGYRAGADRGRAVPHRPLVATRGLHRGPLPRAGHRRTPCGVDRLAVADARPPNALRQPTGLIRSAGHKSELPSLMRISYAVFCLKKKNNTEQIIHTKT